MKIGLADLDTSHHVAWLPLLREFGHTVDGIYDSGTVHSAEYAHRFAAEQDIPQVFDNFAVMADAVDCVVLMGCDWDKRIQQVGHAVEAGKSVLIDKPIAGHVEHLSQLKAWIDDGARITGGSSLRFCYETRDWLAQPVDERGSPQTVLCGCGHEEFFYGIHAAAMLHGIMGTGVQSVRHLGNYQSRGVQRRVQLNWSNGRTGFLVIGPTEKWMNFFTCIITEKGVTQFRTDAGQLYRALFESTLPFLTGDTDVPPLNGTEFIEPELCLLAARYSWRNGDCEVQLSNLPENLAYSSAEFLKTYEYS